MEDVGGIGYSNQYCIPAWNQKNYEDVCISMKIVLIIQHPRQASKNAVSETSMIHDELKAKWSKPIDKLPVYIDFPRLAGKIKIEVLQEIPPYPKVRTMHHLSH
jgi:hypothetical protein